MGYPIAIAGLDHYYGHGALRKQILFDVELSVEPGEIVIMTGPSGSGKTTLLTLIGALRSAQTGSLQVLGQEMVGASDRQRVLVRRHIGYIFQAHNLLDFLTARQNVEIALELQPNLDRATIRDRATQLLEAVGLGHRLDHYPDDLSGGQRQRVAVARALVGNPQLVLADEPTAALDRQSGRDVVELMRSLAREQGCAVLVVTHDHRILDVAHRIVSMEDGRLRSERLAPLSV